VKPDTNATLTGYDDAITGAVLYRVPDGGCLRIAGEDRIDFIQRQTTNDARTLTPDHAQLTVLTSATARILDVWRLVQEDDAIAAITLPGRGAATATYLQRRIFFMDKVTVTDASAEIAQIEVFGPQAAALLSQIGLETPPAPDAITTLELDGAALRVIGLPGVIARGYLLLVDAGAAEAVIAQLAAAGAVSVSADVYDLLRIEAGLPGPAGELTEDYTPLEANLDAAISGSKGCYTGQEVIARQITYDKVARRLVRLRLDAAVPVGAAVQVEGRSAGVVTSPAVSPRVGAIALAVLRRPHFEPGTAVGVVPDGAPDGAGAVSGVTVAAFDLA